MTHRMDEIEVDVVFADNFKADTYRDCEWFTKHMPEWKTYSAVAIK